MKTEKLKDIIKSNDLVIPNVLLSSYKKLNLNEKELILLSYLISFNDFVSFDPISFSNYLNIKQEDILESISNLSEKKCIDIVVKKENGKMKEYIDINPLYDKLVFYIIDDEDKTDNNSKIYNAIESEFGRTLSPIEYETISGWLDSNINEDLIKEALKEAVLNGVNNLKYIDKILYEWGKKGYKTPKDVKKKKAKKESDNPILFDYDWLDDND